MLRIQDGRKLDDPHVPAQRAVNGAAVHTGWAVQDARRRLAELAAWEDPVERLAGTRELMEHLQGVQMAAQSWGLARRKQQALAEVRLDAERLAGATLKMLGLWGGDRRSQRHRERLTLAALGITQNQSKRWQAVASVPEFTYREYLAAAMQAGMRISRSGLLRFARIAQTSGSSGRRNERSEPSRASAAGPPPAAMGAARRLQRLIHELETIAQKQQHHLCSIHAWVVPAAAPRAPLAPTLPNRARTLAAARELGQQAEAICSQAASELKRLLHSP